MVFLAKSKLFLYVRNLKSKFPLQLRWISYPTNNSPKVPSPDNIDAFEDFLETEDYTAENMHEFTFTEPLPSNSSSGSSKSALNTKQFNILDYDIPSLDLKVLSNQEFLYILGRANFLPFDKNHFHPSALKEIEIRLENQQFQVHDVIRILQWIAYSHPLPSFPPLPSSTMRSICRFLSIHLHQMNEQQLSRVIYSCAKLQNHFSNFLDLMISDTIDRLHKFSPTVLMRVLIALYSNGSNSKQKNSFSIDNTVISLLIRRLTPNVRQLYARQVTSFCKIVYTHHSHHQFPPRIISLANSALQSRTNLINRLLLLPNTGRKNSVSEAVHESLPLSEDTTNERKEFSFTHDEDSKSNMKAESEDLNAPQGHRGLPAEIMEENKQRKIAANRKWIVHIAETLVLYDLIKFSSLVKFLTTVKAFSLPFEYPFLPLIPPKKEGSEGTRGSGRSILELNNEEEEYTSYKTQLEAWKVQVRAMNNYVIALKRIECHLRICSTANYEALMPSTKGFLCGVRDYPIKYHKLHSQYFDHEHLHKRIILCLKKRNLNFSRVSVGPFLLYAANPLAKIYLERELPTHMIPRYRSEEWLFEKDWKKKILKEEGWKLILVPDNIYTCDEGLENLIDDSLRNESYTFLRGNSNALTSHEIVLESEAELDNSIDKLLYD